VTGGGAAAEGRAASLFLEGLWCHKQNLLWSQTL